MIYLFNMKKTIIKLIKFLDLDHELTQYEFYRKYKGGTFYYQKFNLPMFPYWSDKIITSCQGRIIEKESYKDYKCTDCGAITRLKDNNKTRVGFCKNCEHPLWN